MKKLLSALFILGSVAALATDEAAADKPGHGGGGDSSCYEQASCTVEKEINLTVKVPKKLTMRADHIDFVTWCGTKTVQKNGNYHLEGEPNELVNIRFEHSTVAFQHETGPSGFTASLLLDAPSRTLHPTLGTADGIFTATLNPGAPGTKPLTGHHSATAKLIAEYDVF